MNTFISEYGLWGILGFIAGLLYLIAVSGKFHKSREDVTYLYVWAAVSCIVGAKLLYLFVLFLSGNLVEIELQNVRMLISEYMRGGFVYYGGAFGTVLGLRIACRYFSLDEKFYGDFIIPALPLAHAISRIGCYKVGCCYGKETDGIIHVIYDTSLFAPNGVALVPVQLVEAAFEIVFWMVLLILSFRKGSEVAPFSLTKLYFAMYATMRFFLEFYRGDLERGFVGILSISQWISLIVILCLIAKRTAQKRLDLFN